MAVAVPLETATRETSETPRAQICQVPRPSAGRSARGASAEAPASVSERATESDAPRAKVSAEATDGVQDSVLNVGEPEMATPSAEPLAMETA